MRVPVYWGVRQGDLYDHRDGKFEIKDQVLYYIDSKLEEWVVDLTRSV